VVGDGLAVGDVEYVRVRSADGALFTISHGKCARALARVTASSAIAAATVAAPAP
jgi:hypothetical protein